MSSDAPPPDLLKMAFRRNAKTSCELFQPDVAALAVVATDDSAAAVLDFSLSTDILIKKIFKRRTSFLLFVQLCLICNCSFLQMRRET